VRILAIGMVSALLFAFDITAVGSTARQSTDHDQIKRVLDVFLSNTGSRLASYRARRTLQASTRGGRTRATLTALTSLTPEDGFQYSVVEETGSTLIRSKVLRPALEAERQISRDGNMTQAAINSENYDFFPVGDADGGVLRIDIRPRRKDTMLIEGSVLVAVDGAELLQIEGTLVKRPSFWTRRVEVVRRYARVSGVRVPVGMRSTADVLLAGRSTFTMTYDDEMINGESIGASSNVADASTGDPADVESEEAAGSLSTER
jgi:hypothetical protein